MGCIEYMYFINRWGEDKVVIRFSDKLITIGETMAKAAQQELYDVPGNGYTSATHREDRGKTRAHPVGRWLFPVLLLGCATPWLSPGIALIVGIAFALTLGNPYAGASQKASKWLLQASVVALGFGMNLQAVLHAGLQGFWFAAASISATWFIGHFLGRALGIKMKTAHLVCAGTAICGGSAIAAVGTVIAAGEAELSVALGTVFLLNAVALFLFPVIGHWLGMSQVQFGTWAGVAIHDISSVVGAGAQYGAHALQVATAVKLSRALWIVPVSIAASIIARRARRAEGDTQSGGKITIPWFIGLFVLASLARTYSPAVAHVAPLITQGAERALTLTLFLIGAGLARHTLRAVGIRPLVMGVVLWAGISCAALWVVLTVLK